MILSHFKVEKFTFEDDISFNFDSTGGFQGALLPANTEISTSRRGDSEDLGKGASTNTDNDGVPVDVR